jgi:tRNA pseudouridine32 synthase/23S rRNA pseudouridine746 synthase
MKEPLQIVTEAEKILDPSRFILKTSLAAPSNSIIEALAGTPLSNASLKDAMEKGALWLTRGNKTTRTRRAKKKLHSGDIITLYYDHALLNAPIPTPELIHDQKDWSVWYKPKGLFSQGTSWGDHHCLYRVVEKKLDRAVFPIHRLDRATSGLMLIGHNKRATKILTQAFENQNISKIYQAKVLGDARVLFNSDNNLMLSPIDDKPAKTEILSGAFEDNKTLLTIKLHTGRKHQIRKHLAQSGFPIIGDKHYGNGTDTELQLEAVRLEFVYQETPYTFTT